MSYESNSGVRTVKGWVLAIDWDEDDQPMAVVIQTEDGTEYLVEETDAADALLDLEDAMVEVTGLVDTSDPDGPTITVSAFEVIDDPVDWDEAEDEDGEGSGYVPEVEDLSDDDAGDEDDEEDPGDGEYDEGDYDGGGDDLEDEDDLDDDEK